MATVQMMSPIISLLLVVIGLAIFWWDGSSDPNIQSDFSYSANIAVSYSQYDTAAMDYGSARSFTGKFYYQLEKRTKNIATIKSAIDVPSMATITQTHGVDARSGVYSPTVGGGTAKEYLFAPANLQPGQSFTTLHIPYNAPGIAQFVAAEQLYGTKVYHYQVSYDTGALIHPGTAANKLASGQSLQYRPRLQLWFEPVSGWLVDVRDDAAVMVVSTATGRPVRPLGTYSAHYTEGSIRQQAAYAGSLKSRLHFERQIAPRIIIVPFIALIFMCIGLIYRQQIARGARRIVTVWGGNRGKRRGA